MRNEKIKFIVMGVTGCGKSTVGKALAEKLEVPFHDADDYHPEKNINKMKSGQPLNDKDRLPWLRILRNLLDNNPEGMVLACSALKASYREILSTPDSEFIYLKIQKDEVIERFRKREGHFMPSSLIDSQFKTLEEPNKAITVNANKSLPSLILSILNMIY